MENYKTYKANDFLEDNVFVAWVNSDFELNNQIFEKLKQESAELQKEISDAVFILQSLRSKSEGIDHSAKKALFARIEGSIKATTLEEKAQPLSKQSYLWPILAAASLVLLFFAKTVFTNDLATVTTKSAQHSKHLLPDHSEITLDAESYLNYSKKFEKNRTVNLSGKAFFEVERGSRFTVQTENGKVEVLGTSFSVMSRNGIFDVSCKTGKVRVISYAKKDSIIILPNEKVHLNGEGDLIKTLCSQNEYSWIDGQYYFENESLGKVLDELERQFNVKIKTSDDVRQLTYTGFFTNKGIEDALHSITWPMKLNTITKSNNTIVISK